MLWKPSTTYPNSLAGNIFNPANFQLTLARNESHEKLSPTAFGICVICMLAADLRHIPKDNGQGTMDKGQRTWDDKTSGPKERTCNAFLLPLGVAPLALGRVIDVDVASLPGSALCVIDADVNVDVGRTAKFFFYIFNAHSVFFLIVHAGAHCLSLCKYLM